ncbi:metallophosphoesterase family protein [Mucilaginibacter phyllosphaerae]|uniref:Metallophosphoesterase n=1 Tax=Mucilaginibacter phyllosphaerae TaxID=1812349 RepID=A0A4Y8ACB8_9SPHI|nr:metallophosphoesterase [Mucilaginibacter phyllosphaerae]MBB3969493.1 putative phosphodiesterase [Mucilaginibacter phyllosphaerae]TEW65729.1 metallophosphoesterase [Mucilaginibacter phyllosphaerae]GGH08946.1 hypothetical protein GCM10007352_14220 [Mucilaginibacter phyllosphaerae]
MNVPTPMIYAHIGDLHITSAKEQNYIDLLSIIAQIETECSNKLDFVYLPGDNADNGLPEQYQLIATALKMLSIPVHIITGDHDMEQGSLANFYHTLPAQQLPKALNIKGINCLFLDVCGPGSGGPDFRLGKPQAEWLTSHLENAKSNDQKTVVFTHTYPADLKDSNEARLLNNVLYANDVLLVDMGHTHYNDLANNGKTIFAATRSTGQIEEGPVGYSLVSVDNGSVGWRFKPLHDAFPFVMITSPADHRLQPDSLPQQNEFIEVHAVVFGRRTVKQVKCRADKQEWTIMTLCEDKITWAAQITHTDASALTVMATDESGRPGIHTIELRGASNHQPKRICNGSDADSIGVWPENGIFGTQLGPNSNGKPS